MRPITSTLYGIFVVLGLLLFIHTPCVAKDASSIQSEIRLLEATRQDLLVQISRAQQQNPHDIALHDSLHTHLNWLDSKLEQARQSLQQYRSSGGAVAIDPTRLNDRRATKKTAQLEELPDNNAGLSSLDEQLTQSIGVFDEHLLQETELAVQQAEPSASQSSSRSSASGVGDQGSDSASSSQTGEGQGEKSADGSGQSRSERQVAGESGEQGSAEQQQGSQTASRGQKSTDGNDASPSGSIGGDAGSRSKPIPSGHDDDIVARQLREAAERETDPELKERLWDEYRKYKQG